MMNVYTLNVGQGQFVVVTGPTEAFIVDTYVPINPTNDVVNVKGALATILSGKKLIGLIVTGFDADHFNEVGMKIVLNKYRPDWIMYPRYRKKTATADACFAAIDSLDQQKGIARYSIELSDNKTRFYNSIAKEFSFEVFSPHAADMNSSNNCSLVVKVEEKASSASYLITGDTENDRWSSILHIFGRAISARVLAAPHHGSKNGTTDDLLAAVSPHTVLVSAGVNNQYGHPSAEALATYRRYATSVYSTSGGNGQSLKTTIDGSAAKTVVFTP